MRMSPNALQGYWGETNKPLVNLAFVAPLLLAYESGLLLLGPLAMRNGADVWLRQLLQFLGFGQYFLLPAITCGLLLAWHHIARYSWRLRGRVLYGMLLESLVFGAALVVIAQLHVSVLAIEPPDSGVLESAGDAVSYVGAGIYEELVFRLMLLSALIAGAQRIGVPRLSSFCAAVILSSVIFAAAHYRFELGGEPFLRLIGEPFVSSVFWFRCMAGVLFSILFLCRGFGIAVGAHALYDILVAC